MYQLRLTAWDLSGRTSEAQARVVVDTSTKTLEQARVTDAVFQLGNHGFALTRSLASSIDARSGSAADAQGGSTEDFGNWTLPILDTQLTHDQAATNALGMGAPWLEGARVWLQVPAGVSTPNAAQQYLSFTLATTSERLGTQTGSPSVLRPAFTSDRGWTLQAVNADDGSRPSLQRQGLRLLDQSTGLPWVPQAFVLTGPDGTRYSLDANGKVQQIAFADGAQWLVSDAGLALVGSTDPGARVEFLRNAQGGIERVSGPTSGETAAIAYRYDSRGRLALARSLFSGDAGTAIGYRGDDQGGLITEAITANLGAAVHWQADTATPSNVWSATLASQQTVHLSYTVRESELASTVKTPGAKGAVILAVETQGAITTINAAGATVLGRATSGGRTVTLLRVEEAGTKLLSVTAEGAVSVRISVAGDLNRDGRIDGGDSTAWEAAAASAGVTAGGDLNGDGLVNAGDRQVLYANYGWRTNQAPVAAAVPSGAALKTHTDLSTSRSLEQVAVDREGDGLFWRVTGATHGVARVDADGQTLVFMPEVGYVGVARITVQADDGYASSAPIELDVNVSGARLMQINIARLATLASGTARFMAITGDFEDEAGVKLAGSYLTYTSTNTGVIVVNADGLVRGVGDGTSIVGVRARGVEGVNVFTVAVDPTTPETDAYGFELDVYPQAITLALSAQRQLKVTLPDRTNISAATFGTKYFIGDASIATVTADGLIVGRGVGVTRLSVIHEGTQHDIVLRILEPVVGPAAVPAGRGVAVQDAEGNMLMVADGTLSVDTTVSIRARALDDLGMPPPAPGVLQLIGAVEIDAGGAKAGLPVQLAVKVSGPVDPLTGVVSTLAPNTEVFFWRKGTILDTDGTLHDTWWLVDNGFVGADGMARTASPPYSGIKGEFGLYAITTITDIDDNTGQIEGRYSEVYVDALWAPSTIGGGIAMAVASSGYYGFGSSALAAFGNTPTWGFKYTLVGSYKKQLPTDLSNVRKALEFDMPEVNFERMTIRHTHFEPLDGKLTVIAGGLVPEGQSPGNFDYKVWLAPRGYQIREVQPEGTAAVRGMVWQGFNVNPTGNDLVVTLPGDIALSMHSIYIERTPKIPQDLHNFNAQSVTSEAVTAWSEPTKNFMLLSAHGIEVMSTDTARTTAGTVNDNAPAVQLRARITVDENGDRLWLAGRLADPIAYSQDGTLAFVAGTRLGKVYVIDTQLNRVIHSVQLTGPSSVTSMGSHGGWLYITEGSRWGGTPARILRLNIDPRSEGFLQQIQSLGLALDAPFGIADMAIGQGGYMAVTTPQQRASFGPSPRVKAGSVYVIDLGMVDRDGAVSGAGVIHVDDIMLGTTSYAPRFVAPGNEMGQFVFTSEQSYNRGFTVLNVGSNADGWLDRSTTTATQVNMSGRNGVPTFTNFKHRLNIQRAAGTAIVRYEGKEYAFVADFNLATNDGWFNSVGVPKQIGGKIGVIEDPFGPNPRYMGATTPIVGASLDHLIVTDEGKLIAEAMVDEGIITGTFVGSVYREMYAWNAGRLIRAAIEAQGRAATIPIDRIGAGDKGQIPGTEAVRIPGAVTGQPFGWTFGSGSFRDPSVPVIVDANPLPPYSIKINGPDVDAPAAQQLTPFFSNDDGWLMTIGKKALDLLITGGYFEGYDKRVADFNAGLYKGTPEQQYRKFTQANMSAALYTGLGIVVTFSTGGVVLLVTKGLTAKMSTAIAAAGWGIAAGVMEAAIEYGLTEVNRITEGASGIKEIDWVKVLTTGGFGALLGGGFAGLAHSTLFQRGAEIINNIMSKIGEVVSLGASKARLLFGRPGGETAVVSVGSDTVGGVGRKINVLDEAVPDFRGGETVTLAGKPLFGVPKAATYIRQDALDWYTSAYNQMVKQIDTSLPVYKQLELLSKAGEAVRSAAETAMIDKDAIAEFATSVFRPRLKDLLDELRRELKLSGHALEERALTELRRPAIGCFVAGTLVHTKDGLKPIEQIKVGDWVLSRPEDPEQGTETGYKRVSKTFKFEDKEVVRFWWSRSNASDAVSSDAVYVTPNHPVWFNPYGWVAMGRFCAPHKNRLGTVAWGRDDEWLEHELVLADGSAGAMIDVLDVYCTDKTEIAFLEHGGFDWEWGKLVDFSKGSPIPASKGCGYNHEHWGELPRVFCTTVYNLEVEDWHTYFVGETGLWVHNTNCLDPVWDEASIKVVRGNLGDLLKNVILIDGKKGDKYKSLTRAELHQHLKNNPLDKGVAVIRMDGASDIAGKKLGDASIYSNGIIFEDMGYGRLIDKAGIRYEFAVLRNPEKIANKGFSDELIARLAEVPYVKMENRYVTASGVEVMVDRKWSATSMTGERLFKPLDQLFRMALSAESNTELRFAMEFSRASDGIGAALRYEELLRKIRSNNIGVTEIRDKDGAVLLSAQDLPLVLDKIRTQLLPKFDMIFEGQIRPTFPFPQNVAEEGGVLDVRELDVADVHLELSQARQYWLDHGASLSRLDRATFAVADLPLGWAARTEGTQITLDARGAGWGWFVDPGAGGNSDFTPVSSDATEQAERADYTAIAGGPADGKLDLLTVLIHELGHVLGLPMPQSADHVMSQYLAPGQRRLPDAVDIAALQALGAGAYVGTLPPVTIGGATGLMVAPAPGYAGSRRTPINATLSNGDFGADGTADWATDGHVELDGNSITLHESPSRQTYLAQGFSVGGGDRLLTFTLVGNSLQRNSTGPLDAFEVALIDANSGKPVGNTVNLSRSDALLNIQTDGTEQMASGLRKVLNPDGSATYYVDLPAALANTPVVLSFDLLGFGAADSSVTLRDIRLISDPIAYTDTATLDEDTPATGNLLANDITVGAAVAQVELVTPPTHGNVTLAADGSFAYIPNANYHGPDAFTYRLVDTDGRISNTATVNLTVRAVNDAPVLGGLPTVAVTAGQPYTFDALAQANDVEGSSLTLEVAETPAHGTLQLLADGRVVYTPDVTYAGADGFMLRANDGEASSAPVRYSFDIAPANTAPVLRGANVALQEDGSLLVDFAGFATDAEGDALSVQIVQAPQHGTLVQQAGNTWRYTPAADFHGTDTLRWQASDGALLSDIATLTFEIASVNDAPVLADAAAAMQEDGTVAIDALATAQDVDGDTLTALLVTGPAHGRVELGSDGRFVYTPDANFAGSDSFAWRVSDGTADSNIATVAITVAAVNDAPVARDASLTLAEDASVVFDLRTFGLDIDSSTLSAMVVTAPAHGGLVLNADGSYSYTPAANYNGTDTLRFRLRDEALDSHRRPGQKPSHRHGVSQKSRARSS